MVANLVVTQNEVRPEKLFVVGSGDFFAGLISSVLAVAVGLSFAALIFSGPLSPWLAYGVAATFVTSAISALVLAIRSSLPFVIAGPDAPTATVTATLAAVLARRIVGNGAPDDLFAPVLLVVALSAILSGILLWVIGVSRASGFIRFIPYPVIGGFLGATGWLMISGAVRVITGVELGFSTINVLVSTIALAKLAAACVFALVLFRGLRGGNPYVLAAILLAGLAASYLALVLTGTTLSAAQAEGWLFSTPLAVSLEVPWKLHALGNFPTDALPSIAGDLIAVMFVTAMTTLLNTTGIEFVTGYEASLDRELKALGVANLLCGALGGYVGCLSLSRTTLNYAAGGRGRLCGLTVAAVSLVMLAAEPSFLSFVPRFLPGGLLLYLGVSLIFRWLVDSARRLSWLEYGSLLAIALLIIQAGFIAGVLTGVVIGCVTFAVSASRVNAIKFSFDGSEYHSSLDRGPEELAILAAKGQEIQGMRLQDYLFFGSAHRLYQHVKTLLANRPECRFLTFDFRLVSGMDSSAMHSFTQIRKAADKIDACLVLANLSPELRTAFRSFASSSEDVVLADDLDHALEFCEGEVIAAHSGPGWATRGLRRWLTKALGSAEFAKQLMARCERLEVREGQTIASQGDVADCMHFILEGRLGVTVKLEDGRSIRLRSLGPHTTTGEMGLITRQLRSATIQAERKSVLYSLSTDAYERIKRENCPLGHALLTYVITVMAERLSYANKAIGVLSR